jgi:hypothetical protein
MTEPSEIRAGDMVTHRETGGTGRVEGVLPVYGGFGVAARAFGQEKVLFVLAVVRWQGQKKLVLERAADLIGVMTVKRTIRLRGGSVSPSALVWKMREHLVEVEPWEPPEEDRGLGTEIIIGLVVNGVYDAIKAALADFLATFPQADADIEEDEDEDEDDSEEDVDTRQRGGDRGEGGHPPAGR